MTTIATHNGIVHADEALGTAILLQAVPEVQVVRTRDPEALAQADIRLDVGGISNPSNGDFDHHQKGGAGARKNGIPYASAGLVWKHFGVEIAGSEEAARHVDERLIQPIDAVDTGCTLCEPRVEGVHPYTLSHFISSLNPTWQEEGMSYEACFFEAVHVAKVALSRVLAAAGGEIEAREVVREAISQATQSGNPFLVLENFAPWQETAIRESDALFVVFPAPTGDWRVQCIPPEVGSFDKRRPLPEHWAGLRGEELVEASGVPDAVFCHPGRFIAGATTRDGAVALATIASS